LRFFVEWGWDRLKEEEWTGSLQLRGGKIVEAVPCFRGGVENRKGRGITGLTEDSCRWLSRPRQFRVSRCARAFADAIAFEVDCDEGAELRLAFAYGGFKREEVLKAEDILSEPRVAYMEPVPPTDNGAYWHGMESYAKYKLHRGYPTDALTLDLEYADAPGDNGGTDFYYVRVIQKNGQRAWSSPVWVDPE
jgi:hypothetical protein